MTQQVDTEDIVALFETIRAAFPHLEMTVERYHRYLDVAMDIPEQPGLAFTVALSLQGNELHLYAGEFRFEWFPCTRADIVSAYREAVHGLLSGSYRIVEHWRGSRAVKAQLQRPVGVGWETIFTTYKLDLLFWVPKTERALRNDPQRAAE